MKNCCDLNNHPDHSEQLPKLNRITGQVEGIKKMIEERRYCPDILIQLRAARAALHSIEANLLEAHLHACVIEAFNSDDEMEKNKKIQELKDLYKSF